MLRRVASCHAPLFLPSAQASEAARLHMGTSLSLCGAARLERRGQHAEAVTIEHRVLPSRDQPLPDQHRLAARLGRKGQHAEAVTIEHRVLPRYDTYHTHEGPAAARPAPSCGHPSPKR
jgi:hypothetical protein